MDVLRGCAIVLVVVNHSILFQVDVGVPPQPAVAVNGVFAPVRMPLIVFLSGLLVAPSLRKGASIYLQGKWRGVLYPYAIWSMIALGIDAATNVASDTPVEWAEWARPLYWPILHLWFLYYLFAYYLIALLTRHVSAIVFSALSLVACFVAPGEWQRFFLLLAFFMAGKWASEGTERFASLLQSPTVRVAAILLAIGGVVLALFGVQLRYAAVSAPFVAGTIVVAIWASSHVEHASALKPLRFVGRHSLVYYLVHWYGTVVGVNFASRVTEDAWVIFASGVICGLASGTVAALAVHIFPRIELLFSLPKHRARPGPDNARYSS